MLKEETIYAFVESCAGYAIQLDSIDSKVATINKEGFCYSLKKDNGFFFYSDNELSRGIKKLGLPSDNVLTMLSHSACEIQMRMDKVGLQNAYVTAWDELGKIGQVENLRLSYTCLNTKRIHVSCDEELRTSFLRIKQVTINAVIICGNNHLFFNRDLFYDDENPLSERVLAECQRYAALYAPFAKRPFFDMGGYGSVVMPEGDGGILFHEAVGHVLEADHVFAPSSIAMAMIGKKIADSGISVLDACNHRKSPFSFCADDGSRQDTVELIAHGEISGILSCRQASMEFSIDDTGNGRTSSYENKVLPRMRTTYLLPGCEDVESIVSSTRTGIIAGDIDGGKVNFLTGDFVFKIPHGLVIEHGEPVGIARPIMFQGNSFDVLKRITSIGNNLAFVGGICSKAGQCINVAYGCPTYRIDNVLMEPYK